MDFFFFLFLVRLVDFGGSEFLSLLSVEEIDEAEMLQVLAKLNRFISFSAEEDIDIGSSSLYLSGSTRGWMSVICGRLAPLTIVPMSPLELSKQTGTAVRGK